MVPKIKTFEMAIKQNLLPVSYKYLENKLLINKKNENVKIKRNDKVQVTELVI